LKNKMLGTAFFYLVTMQHKDLLNLVFHEFEDGHDMINFGEISRRCNQIFHQNIKIDMTDYSSKFMKNNQGQKHGICRQWTNGRLHFEDNYCHHKLHGITRAWYKNGQLDYIHNWWNHLLHGISYGWHENGQLRYENNWYLDQKHGIQQSWTSQGELLFSVEWYYGHKK